MVLMVWIGCEFKGRGKLDRYNRHDKPVREIRI
jgi:hypothetical protein